MTDNRKKLPCAVVRDLLPLYHDGVVSSDTGELIEEHLGNCESCRNELNSIRDEETIERNIIEQDKSSSFKEFRNGVRVLRRNGTIRGLLIALVALACFIGMLVFLNNEDIVEIDPSDLKIEDVYRYDLGENGEGLFFTYTVSWSGDWSMTFEDTKNPAEMNLLFKRTALGGKMENDIRNPRGYMIVDDFYKTNKVDISKAEIVKVNGQTIWTKDQGIDNDPPEYINELVKYGKDYDDMNSDNKAINATIDSDSVSITYADLHGIKWDKRGSVIATFTVDENGEMISMERYPEKKD